MTIHVEAAMDLTIGSITGSGGNMKKLNKTLAGSGEKLGEAMTGVLEENMEAILKLYKTGMKSAGEDLLTRTKALGQLRMTTEQNIKQLNADIRKASTEDEKQKITLRRDAALALLEQQETAHKDWVEREMKGAERRAEILEAADKRAKMDSFEVLQEVGRVTTDTTESIANALSSKSLDMQSLTGGGIGGLSKVMEVAGGSMVKAGGSLGKAGIMMSTAAAGLAAAAGAITAIVAVFGAAYGQAKEYNQEIVSGGNAMNLLAVSGKNLSGTLEDVRKASLKMGTQMRMDSKEIIGAMNEFHNAGMSLSNLTSFVKGNTDAMSKLSSVTTTAILASKGFGIEVSDFAGFAEQFRKMGYGLTEVEGAFGMISYEARKAGVTTKSFFTAINEASSGMAMYNFRVGDTVGLFSDLVGILGEDLAKSKLGLEKTFGTMGFQERFQATLTTGKATSQSIVKADAQAQAKEFAKNFGDIAGLGNVGGAGNVDVAALGKLNEKQFQQLLMGIVGESTEQENLAKQQLQSLYTLSKGVEGSTSAVAMSLGGLSKQGEIAMELASGQALLGGKSLAEAADNPATRMLLEQQLGMSGEQLEQNIRIERALMAEYEGMKAIAEAEGKTMGSFYEELAAGTLSNTKTMEAASQAEYSMLENVGRQQLIETQSISTTISNTIAGLLEGIYGILEYFVGKDDDTQALQDIRDLQKEQRQQQNVVIEETKKLNDLKLQATGEKDVTKRSQLLSQIESQQAKVDKLSNKENLLGETAKNLQMGMSGSEARNAAFSTVTGQTAEDYFRGKSTQEQMNAGFLQREVSTSGGSAVQQAMVKASIGTQGASISAETKAFADSLGVSFTTAWSENSLDSELLDTALNQYTLDEQQATQDKKRAEEKAKLDKEELSVNKKILQQLENQEMEKLVKASGLDSSKVTEILERNNGASQLANIIKARPGEDQRSGLAVLGRAMNDFIYRGNGRTGTINPIDTKDDFFGAKPGGAIDKAIGMSGQGNVNITINGIKDADGVARAVASTLKKMGYGSARMYSK